jgi:hypothetical protein
MCTTLQNTLLALLPLKMAQKAAARKTGEMINISVFHKCVGHAVAQLVEALRYKPAGRGFYSRWCHWNFSFT